MRVLKLWYLISFESLIFLGKPIIFKLYYGGFMIFRFIYFVFLIMICVLFAGCGKKEETAAVKTPGADREKLTKYLKDGLTSKTTAIAKYETYSKKTDVESFENIAKLFAAGYHKQSSDMHNDSIGTEHDKNFRFDKDHPSDCKNCHTTNDFNSYTCYNCHEHSPEKIKRIHLKEGIRNTEKCAECHKGSRENDIKGHERHDDDEKHGERHDD